MEFQNTILLPKIIETITIALAAVSLFFGLKSRILKFAEWANLPRLAFTPVQAIFRYSILVIAFFLVLNCWGFELSSLLTLLGTALGLVAIGFVAVWSVLSNFLCTFVLIVFKPFSVGDELEIPADSVKGKVVDLTLLFTTLQTPAGEYVMIPNNMFFQKIFKRSAGAKTVELDYQFRQDRPLNLRDSSE